MLMLTPEEEEERRRNEAASAGATPAVTPELPPVAAVAEAPAAPTPPAAAPTPPAAAPAEDYDAWDAFYDSMRPEPRKQQNGIGLLGDSGAEWGALLDVFLNRGRGVGKILAKNEELRQRREEHGLDRQYKQALIDKARRSGGGAAGGGKTAAEREADRALRAQSLALQERDVVRKENAAGLAIAKAKRDRGENSPEVAKLVEHYVLQGVDPGKLAAFAKMPLDVATKLIAGENQEVARTQAPAVAGETTTAREQAKVDVTHGNIGTIASDKAAVRTATDQAGIDTAHANIATTANDKAIEREAIEQARVDNQLANADAITGYKVKIAQALAKVDEESKQRSVEAEAIARARGDHKAAEEYASGLRIPGLIRSDEKVGVQAMADEPTRRHLQARAGLYLSARRAMDKMVALREKYGTELPGDVKSEFDVDQTAINGALSAVGATGVLSDTERDYYMKMVPNLTAHWLDPLRLGGTDITLQQLRGARRGFTGVANGWMQAYGHQFDEDYLFNGPPPPPQQTAAPGAQPAAPPPVAAPPPAAAPHPDEAFNGLVTPPAAAAAAPVDPIVGNVPATPSTRRLRVMRNPNTGQTQRVMMTDEEVREQFDLGPDDPIPSVLEFAPSPKPRPAARPRPPKAAAPPSAATAPKATALPRAIPAGGGMFTVEGGTRKWTADDIKVFRARGKVAP